MCRKYYEKSTKTKLLLLCYESLDQASILFSHTEKFNKTIFTKFNKKIVSVFEMSIEERDQKNIEEYER